MCDYSLEMYGSRPAREGERYQTTRFPSGSIGLASPGDATCPVCVQYDTTLLIENIPNVLQQNLGISANEEVTFVRLDHGAYRDGIKFRNGKEVSLQQLQPGIAVSVRALLENVGRIKTAALVD